MSTSLDLTGRLFGRLTVLSRLEGSTQGHTRWECRCDCGNTKNILGSSLVKGATKSCGCLRKEKTKLKKFIDLTNQRFGKLLVLSTVEGSRWGQTVWRCRCDCGNTIDLPLRYLRSGDTTSCGCIKKVRTERWLEEKTKQHQKWAWRTEKKCARCTEIKPVLEFVKNASSRDGLGSYCIGCHNTVGRENRAKNHNTRGYHLKRRYGITQQDFDRILESQNGLCAICEAISISLKSWHVDHCHKTGKVRGILCHQCNMGLGAFKDDISTLRRVIHYLEDHIGKIK